MAVKAGVYSRTVQPTMSEEYKRNCLTDELISSWKTRGQNAEEKLKNDYETRKYY